MIEFEKIIKGRMLFLGGIRPFSIGRVYVIIKLCVL